MFPPSAVSHDVSAPAAPQEASADAMLMSRVFDVSKVKSGPAAGTLVPLASIVVTDQSDVKMKVVLWRRAAFWALTVHPGDVLLVTGKVWQSVCGGGALVTSSALINFSVCYLATNATTCSLNQRCPHSGWTKGLEVHLCL